MRISITNKKLDFWYHFINCCLNPNKVHKKTYDSNCAYCWRIKHEFTLRISVRGWTAFVVQKQVLSHPVSETMCLSVNELRAKLLVSYYGGGNLSYLVRLVSVRAAVKLCSTDWWKLRLVNIIEFRPILCLYRYQTYTYG